MIFDQKNKGFTLLEITVVIAVIALLSTIFLANYRGGEKQYALLRASHKLAQDLRTIEEMALSSRKTPTEVFGGTFPRGGYGIYITNNPTGDYQCATAPSEKGGYCIILFADCDEGQDYDFQGSAESCALASSTSEGDSVNEKIKDLVLEAGIKIIDISPTSLQGLWLAITFLPPDPTVIINNDPTISSAYIRLGYEGKAGGQQIIINRFGQIEISSYQ